LPTQAAATEPRQRLLLEAGYAALHGGGWRRATLAGAPLGVFVGLHRPAG
jgi:acyl transferase domain-containing protein